MDVRINSASTNVGVVDRSVLLSPEVVELVISVVKARLDEDRRIAMERERDTGVEHR